jgi:hypothetical protein
MRSRTTALCLAFAVVLACASPLRAQEIWKGQVKQNVGSENFTVVMKLSGDGGETDYPELKCGGTLKRVGQSGAYRFYIEKITRKGIGCVGGAITVVKSNGVLSWGWVGAHDGQTLAAWSILTRQ